MENVIFELITPPTTWGDAKVAEWIVHIIAILKRQGIFTVNLPEVVDETRTGQRSVAYVPKVDNVRFAAMIKRKLHDVVPMPNKVTVRQSKKDFEEWIHTTYDSGIRHVVLVGGEHSNLEYPGYSVSEGAEYVKANYPDVKVGAITIFTRPAEHLRILNKMRSGVDFFCSQIIFETDNMKHVLLHLKRLCEKHEIDLPKVYISLSPAFRIKEIEFMKWLGVEFPSAIRAYLTESLDEHVETRTFEVLQRLLDEIYAFREKEKLDLGFNVEHVMYGNLDLAEKLIKDIRVRNVQ